MAVKSLEQRNERANVHVFPLRKGRDHMGPVVRLQPRPALRLRQHTRPNYTPRSLVHAVTLRDVY